MQLPCSLALPLLVDEIGHSPPFFPSAAVRDRVRRRVAVGLAIRAGQADLFSETGTRRICDVLSFAYFWFLGPRLGPKDGTSVD